jgi:hypothetical protein
MVRTTPLYSSGELIEAERQLPNRRSKDRKFMLPLIHLALRELNVN